MLNLFEENLGSPRYSFKFFVVIEIFDRGTFSLLRCPSFVAVAVVVVVVDDSFFDGGIGLLSSNSFCSCKDTIKSRF
jgi:hypothetical protein